MPSDLAVFDPMIQHFRMEFMPEALGDRSAVRFKRQLFRMEFLFMPEVLLQVIRFRSRQHFRMEFMPEVLFSNALSSHV